MTVIRNGSIISLFLVSVLITSHFGKNPMKGGSPPKDKKLIINENLMILKLLIELMICFI